MALALARSVESFMQAHADRCMSYQVKAIVGLCHVPFLAVRSGVAHHLGDEGAVGDHFTVVLGAYRSTGATDAQTHAVVIRPQGHSACTVTVRWHVLGADGALLRDFETAYHLVAHEESW